MSFVNWILDLFPAADDIIDLQFNLTELEDIEFTEEQRYECAEFDSTADEVARRGRGKRKVPLGKATF